MRRVKPWEIIADKLHDAGFSLGWVSAIDLKGRTIWIVDAHGYGKRFIVRADEILGCVCGDLNRRSTFCVTGDQFSRSTTSAISRPSRGKRSLLNYFGTECALSRFTGVQRSA